MRRSSGRKAQVEPLAALVVVAALGLALTLHASVLADVRPATSERDVATGALVDAVAALRTGAVVVPASGNVTADAPDGYRVRVTVRADTLTWRSGPTPPSSAASASRAVPVQTGPGTVLPGRVRVEVWPWTAA